MPEISTMKDSKFLKRADCGAGILLTIESCEQMNVGKDDGPAEMKWGLNFIEDVKPMILNSTNAELIGMFSGKSNSDDWHGVKIVAYDDPSVGYGGKLVGGIRVRAPRGKGVTAAKPVSPPTEPEADVDDIPF